MSETWDFWHDTAHSPSFNMAADEILLETAPARGRPLLRFYGWDRLAVSIGCVQSLSAAPSGYAVVRRPTGGGVVYHDFDFTYTVVVPAQHWLNGLNRLESYDRINQAVQTALTDLNYQASLSPAEMPHEVDRLTMVCFTNPTRYDVLHNGAKVAGSAQRRTQDGILHQGSLHFGGPLPMPRQTLGGALLSAFQRLLQVSFVPFEPTDAELALMTERAENKFASDAWNAKR